MPYKIVKKDDKWCVQKKDNSKTLGCHSSEEKAKRQMSALYANENKSIAEFSMAIIKASIPNKGDRTMRLSMVNSDTGEDAYEERMSVELFNDFVERIENNTPIPEPFNGVIDEGWNGGMPYLSISHYKSGAGKNVPGMPEKVYVDGERLKSRAILNENPLGLAVWKAVNVDLEERDKPIEERAYRYPVRISIGFLDLQHKHEIEGEEDFIFTRSELKQKCEKCEAEINGKVYLKGQLVHLAFTRVPANPRTQVEVLRMSDEIETRKDDAESIIGELAEELVGKSTVEDDVLVVKADSEEDEGRDRKKKKEDDEDESLPEKSEVIMEESTQVQAPVGEEVKEPVAVETSIPVKSKVEQTVEQFLAKYAEVKKNNLRGDAAIQELQPVMKSLAEATNEEIADPNQAMAETFRSIIREELAAYEERTKPELVKEVLKAMPKQEATQEIPVPRSLQVQRSAPVQKQDDGPFAQLRAIAKKSVQVGQQ